MLILGCAWTSHGARALDAPPSVPRRPQVGSHLRPGPGMGGALRFHQVLSDTSSPLRKLRTGLKQQRPLPGASSGQRSPAPARGTAPLPGSSLDGPSHAVSEESSPRHCPGGPCHCPGGPRGPRGGAGCWSAACFPRGGEGGRPHSGRSRRRAGSGHKTEPRFSETASRCLASPSLSFPACGAIRCGAFGIKMTRNGTCGFGAFAPLRHWRFGSKGGRFLHHVIAAM